jgi:uncharacterized integral membrane protein (TIGR00698 family)
MPATPPHVLMARALIVAGAAFCLTPWASPPVALLIGLILALTVGNPFRKVLGKATKILLQVSVVGLGFGMKLGEVIEAGRTGIVFTTISIIATLALGHLIGRMLGINRRITHLIASGTAICGGSAIAAVAPVLEADEREVAVSLGVVFILNSIALFVFPWAGHLMSLSPHAFGLWCAVAIHDTSSVVGAAARYGGDALGVATTVKLARALWIVPLALGTALAIRRKSAKIAFPWFIVAFVGAALLASVWPQPHGVWLAISKAARTGLTLTLFLIGAGLSRDALRVVGFRPVVLGVVLWLIVLFTTLAVVRAMA